MTIGKKKGGDGERGEGQPMIGEDKWETNGGTNGGTMRRDKRKEMAKH